MLIVGLTGGIASGKTAVSDYFAELGVPIIDTDIIARQVVEPGTVGLSKVVEAFGQDILDHTEALDRGKLREIVFSSPEKRRQLESILHPLIQAESRRQISELSSPYCLLVVPLLIESNMQSWVNRILVVDVDAQTQITRLTRRDKTSVDQAQKILDAQISRKARLAKADDIISNDKGLDELKVEVKRLHEKYLELASNM